MKFGDLLVDRGWPFLPTSNWEVNPATGSSAMRYTLSPAVLTGTYIEVLPSLASRAVLLAAAWFQADWNWSSSAVETGYLIACNKVATSAPFLIPLMGLSAVQGGTRARPWYVHGMLGEATYVGFIPVRDTSEARRFYEGTLGLQVLEDTPFALVVEAKATMLRITPVPELTVQPFTITGWHVADVA